MIAIKKVKGEYNKFKFSATFSAGQILSIKNALETHAKTSCIAEEILAFLNQEVKDNTELKEFLG